MTAVREVTTEPTPEPEPTTEFTGRIIKLNHQGDVTLAEWDVADQATVDAARATFVKARAEGNAIYDASGPQRTIVRDFDPAAETLVVIPALQGG